MSSLEATFTSMKTGNTINPINLEIFNNLFSSICEEMGAVLCRSSFSTNIKERKDFSCALFDAEGEMVAQAEHLPVHLASMSLSVKAAITSVDMKKGDAVIVNDPYRGGTHLPDITIVTPLFYKNKKAPLFFVANRAHHADVGGCSPGSIGAANDIFQEGVRVPPVKIVVNDEINNDLMELILANVRSPAERRWDLIAQLSANSIGRQRLEEMVGKYGTGEMLKYSGALRDYSEKFMRSVISEIKDGAYTFEDYLDDDGVSNKPVKIKVKIIINKDNACVDFTGTSRQVEGSVNTVYAVAVSAVFYVFRCMIKHDVPSNSGCMRPIRIIAPEGTVVNATHPSAVSAGNVETSQRIVDAILGALSKAAPDKIPAASCGSMNNIAIGGYDQTAKKHFTYYETIAGGAGAGPELNGANATQTHMTNTMNTPVEAIEHNFPFRIKQYSIRRNSGGNGNNKGGDGIIREYEILNDVTLTILSDRRRLRPYGLKGGETGKTGENILISKGKKQKLPSKATIKAAKGDVIMVLTPGGGGYGKP